MESKGCTPKVLGVKLENISPISGNGQVTAVDCGDTWQNMVCVCVCVFVCVRMLAQGSRTWAVVQVLWSRLRYTNQTSDVSLRPLDLAGSAHCPENNGINPVVRSGSLFSSAQVRPYSISNGVYSDQCLLHHNSPLIFRIPRILRFHLHPAWRSQPKLILFDLSVSQF